MSGRWTDDDRRRPRSFTCRDAIELLVDYVEQALPPETLAGLDRHLAGCQACVAYLDTYRNTQALTGAAARVPMPEDVRMRLRQFLLDHLHDR